MEKAKFVTTIARRRLLEWLGALGILSPPAALGQGDSDPAMQPPATGDLLVHAFGERSGQEIAPADLEQDKKQIFAFARDPATGVVRNGNRLHQVVVIRLDPAMLSEETLARSAEGVVAYSGVCSHTGCDVTDWNAEGSRFQCPCHESQFDPADAARVVGGPAPWSLAALPLTLVDGKLGVAGEFIGRIGFMPPGEGLLGL